MRYLRGVLPPPHPIQAFAGPACAVKMSHWAWGAEEGSGAQPLWGGG